MASRTKTGLYFMNICLPFIQTQLSVADQRADFAWMTAHPAVICFPIAVQKSRWKKRTQTARLGTADTPHSRRAYRKTARRVRSRRADAPVFLGVHRDRHYRFDGIAASAGC